MEKFRYISGVTTLVLDNELCIGCGMCGMVCPQAVFRLEDGKARIVDHDGCMECGACMTNCPVAAVSVDPGTGCAALIIGRWLNSIGINAKGCC